MTVAHLVVVVAQRVDLQAVAPHPKRRQQELSQHDPIHVAAGIGQPQEFRPICWYCGWRLAWGCS